MSKPTMKTLYLAVRLAKKEKKNILIVFNKNEWAFSNPKWRVIEVDKD